MAKFCKHCGNELKEGTKFCAKCGTPTGTVESSPPAPNAWTCPACGHENAKGKFCAKCGGGKLEEAPTVPVEAPVAPAEPPAPQPDDKSVETAPPSTSPDAWTCPACGHENAKGKFCAKCGGGKPAGTPATPAGTPTPPSETKAAAEPPSPPPEMQAAAPPPPEIPKTAPTENIQGGAIPQAPEQSSNPRSKKPLILLAVLAVVAIAVFFGSGKMIDSYYTSKAEECAAILTESKSLLDNLAEIPGDAASDDVKKVAEGLAKNADKLNSIRSGIIGKLPRNPQQEKTWDAIGKNAEMLSKAAAIVQSQERAFAPMSIKRFSALCDECMAKWDEANTAATYATVKNQPLSDLIPYADIKKDLQTYRRNKQAFDAKYAQEKYNEERKKHQEQHNELKKKSEVVFLADNAYKNGSDLILSGRFYNGTGDLVTSIMDMQIDLKVSLFGTEVQSLKDEPFSLQLSGLRLMPQQTTDVVQLRLPGKAPEEDFNEFEEHVHKIRWSRMKAR